MSLVDFYILDVRLHTFDCHRISGGFRSSPLDCRPQFIRYIYRPFLNCLHQCCIRWICHHLACEHLPCSVRISSRSADHHSVIERLHNILRYSLSHFPVFINQPCHAVNVRFHGFIDVLHCCLIATHDFFIQACGLHGSIKSPCQRVCQRPIVLILQICVRVFQKVIRIRLDSGIVLLKLFSISVRQCVCFKLNTVSKHGCFIVSDGITRLLFVICQL